MVQVIVVAERKAAAGAFTALHIKQLFTQPLTQYAAAIFLSCDPIFLRYAMGFQIIHSPIA
jgi:hypothetical protein